MVKIGFLKLSPLIASLLLVSCQSSDGQSTGSSLEVSPYLLELNAAGEVLESDLSVLPNVSVHVAWDNQQYDAQTTASGSIVFDAIQPSVEKPADVRLTLSEQSPVYVLGLVDAKLNIGLQVTEAVETDSPSENNVLLRGVVRDWVVSQIGNRNEILVRHQNLFGKKIPDFLASIEDRYATASPVPGSGQLSCACPDGGNMCTVTDIVCNDPGEFAAGASGFSVYLPQGVNELGLIERITETETGDFIETGGVFHDTEFDTGNTNVVEQEFSSQIEPNYDLCGVEGFAYMQFIGLDRKFVLATPTGLSIRLDLVSPTGLALPILTGKRWPPGLVETTGLDSQKIRWRYPFRLNGALSGFSYQYEVESQAVRIGPGAERYIDSYRVRGRAEEDICDVQIDFSQDPVEFLSPTSTVSLSPNQQEISWLGTVAPVRWIEIRDLDANPVAQIWLVDQDQLQIDLQAPIFSEFSLSQTSYTLTYGVFADVESPTSLLRPFSSRGEFRQSHQFSNVP